MSSVTWLFRSSLNCSSSIENITKASHFNNSFIPIYYKYEYYSQLPLKDNESKIDL